MKNTWYTMHKQMAGIPPARFRPAPLLRLLAFALLALFVPLLSQAQAMRSISGKVLDAQSVGLPGVSVVVVGTAIGASTNSEGVFELQVPETATTLSFSFVGYTTQRVSITGKTSVQVSMLEDAQQLNDVVVLG